MFNERQKEGFASLIDMLAASAIIGFFIGVFGHSQFVLTSQDKACLIFAAVSLPLLSFWIRE